MLYECIDLIYWCLQLCLYIHVCIYRERVSGVTYKLLEVLISDLSVTWK